MKRPIKPFVVEVRKGQRKTAVPEPKVLQEKPQHERPQEDDALRRAEAALFGRPADLAPEAPSAGAPQRMGRILETIPVSEPEPELEAEEPLGRRRGRPPGSKNKPKADAPLDPAPRRRGRPPRNPEGEVRRVALTPELANAALESIAKAGVPQPIMRIPVGATASPAEPVVKRPRGRPRKTEQRPESRRDLTPAPAFITAPDPMTAALPRSIRKAMEAGAGEGAAILATLVRPRAGERWKRRLRGPARATFERRHRKD